PSSPSATSSTSRGPGSEVKTISAPAAAWRGLSTQRAPRASSGSAAAGRTALTTTSWPAFNRFMTFRDPIVPSQIKPTRIAQPSRSSEPDIGAQDSPQDRPGAEAGGSQSSLARGGLRAPRRAQLQRSWCDFYNGSE